MLKLNRILGLVAGALALGTALMTGCGQPEGCTGDYCGTLVIAAPGEPTSLLPAVTDAALDRDVFDQLFLKLADIGADGNTVGDTGFEPQLAERWEWTSPLTLVFHLDTRARWHDGQPVTAADVAFTWRSYTDTLIDSPYRANLRQIASVVASDPATVTFTFADRYPEMFFDAVYHMRILPAHLLDTLPPAGWNDAPFGRAPVGSGPYRFVRWTAGQTVELAADSTFFLGRPYLRRVIWRFTPDLTVAVTQVVAGEADAIQVLATPANIERATQAPQLALHQYAGSVYNLVSFNLRANGNSSLPHPLFGDPVVRRALVLATDRERMAQSVFGGHARVPPGPMSQLWQPLWFGDLVVPPHDSAEAVRLLESRGWALDADGVRTRRGQRLAFRLAVPGSSGTRKQYAQLIQEQLRLVGVEVTIDQMESATMGEKERAGAYDAAIESWSTDPSPVSGLIEAWRQDGPSNFGHYANPRFDQAADRARTATSAEEASRAWHEALTTLADDAPAIMLAAMDNTAAIDKRITNVRLRPDSWWAYLRTWRIPADQLTDRDRAAR